MTEKIRVIAEDNANAIIVYNMLKHGEENAVTKDEFAAHGIEERSLRRANEVLRKSGVPVLSNSRDGGYYLPDLKTEKGIKEVVLFIKENISRGRKAFEIAEALKDYLRTVGQVNVDDLMGESNE